MRDSYPSRMKIHRRGLTRLRSVAGSDHDGRRAEVHIIFVHGLRGHPKDTWESNLKDAEAMADTEDGSKPWFFYSMWWELGRKFWSLFSIPTQSPRPSEEEKRMVFWPVDLLAQRASSTPTSKANLYTYGYNADVIHGAFQASNKNSISQHGRDLFRELDREINDQLPIIFIAHSLGGIIVKNALLLSQSSAIEAERRIANHCKYVVFLGTPHRGSSKAGWSSVASNLAGAVLQDINSPLVQALNINSEILDNIQNDFLKLMRQNELKIISFQEARGMSGVKGFTDKVVDDFSSKIEDPHLESVESIDADHIRMVKFASADDSGFRKLSGVLDRAIATILQDQAKTVQEILEWLSPQDPHDKQCDVLSRRHPNTGNWLLESQAFQAWLDSSNPNQTLWCPGDPGCGKTVLASVIIDHVKNKYESENVGLAYVYCDYEQSKVSQGQTADLLMRALFRSLLNGRKQVPGGLHSILNDVRRKDRLPYLEEVLPIFEKTVRSFTIVYVVVDALDECIGAEQHFRNEQKRLLGGERKRFLNALRSLLKSHSPRFRLLVTSRRNLMDFFRDCPHLEIKATAEDIKAFLQEGLDNEDGLQSILSDNPGLKDKIIAMITSQVQGMFLVAVLRLELLRDVTNEYQIEEVLKYVPDDYKDSYFDLYERTMARVNAQTPNKKALAISVLKWLVIAERTLLFGELNDLLTIDPRDAHGSARLPNQYIRTKTTSESILTSACAGLVRIEGPNRTIRLVHFTAKEYFNCELTTYFPTAHLDLAKACLIWKSFNPGVLASPFTASHLYRSHDISYAQGYWATHLERCSNDWDEDVQLLLQRRTYEVQRSGLLSWTNILVAAIKEERLQLIQTFLEKGLFSEAQLPLAFKEVYNSFEHIS